MNAFRIRILYATLMMALMARLSAQDSLEAVAEHYDLNPLSHGVHYAPELGTTPGHFGGAITPARFVIQKYATEGGGVSLNPKLRKFKAIEGSYTWQGAVNDAKSRGGRLATITSEAEQLEVMAAIGTSGGSLWLGGADNAVEGQWQWITGEPFIYSNWNAGEPNDAGGNEDYLQLVRSTGRWNDMPEVQSVILFYFFGTPIYGIVPVTMGYILEIENNTEVVRGGIGNDMIFVESMIVGMPYMAKASEFLIGGLIRPPAVNENEELLAELPVPLAPEEYWETKPLNVEESLDVAHNNYGRFHYSESANQVFATRAGGMKIAWVKRVPASIPPVGPEASDTTKWLSRGGVFFRVMERDYVVSASPVKKPRRIFWTEGEGAQGVPVYIPQNRVFDLSVVFHGAFPKQVPIGEGSPVFDGGVGSSDPGANQGEAESRSTLVFSRIQNMLRAANREGRVFVELLGSVNASSGLPEHLGFEVVDVVARTVPHTGNVEIGDPFPQPPQAVQQQIVLHPRVANIPEGNSYVYRFNPTNSDEDNVYYATRETRNANDLMMWWMIQGEQGILWPEMIYRYNLAWPTDPTKYSHYVRPEVANEEEAMETAVAVPRENSPIIEYQDFEGSPRANFTPDFNFYTFLDNTVPAHRTLLSFKSGDAVAFERVFSWFQPRLESDAWGDTIAATLSTWQTFADEDENPVQRMEWANILGSPRLVNATVNVGQRIDSPEEVEGHEGYLAGYVHLDATRHDNYNLFAYINPFVAGFEEAAAGSIIPVNALPGRDTLTVYWFRKNNFPANSGFGTIFWPSVIGRYQLRWPHEDPAWVPDHLVLASNAGTGALESLQASGSVYVQNAPEFPGYNPNEEHALMAGGQGYALRDDLNVISGDGFTSHPYLLLMYLDENDRPDMRAFRVIREDATYTFVRDLAAGTVVQPPMPLPLMQKPVPGKVLEEQLYQEGLLNLAVDLNHVAETVTISTSTSTGTPTRWTLGSGSRIAFGDFARLFLEPPASSSDPTLYFVSDAVNWPTDISGYVSEVPSLDLPVPDPEFPGDGIDAPHVRYTLDDRAATFLGALEAGDSVLVVDRGRRRVVELEVVSVVLNNRVLVLSYENSNLSGLPVARDWLDTTKLFTVFPTDNADLVAANGLETYRLTADRFPPELASSDAQFSRYAVPLMKDRKGNQWAYRGPHLDSDGSAQFQAHWFYKTLAGFYFPGYAVQPPVGSIAPYLRPQRADGTYIGPDYIDQSTTQVASYPVTYRVVWPEGVPELRPGQTLAHPIFGLPAIRGNTSAEILYHQSRASETGNPESATLMDPTRDKYFALGQTARLDKIPVTIRTSQYRGKTYFPNLPPHLAERLFLDPNRGEKGTLVFMGEFKDEPVGEDYFFLNVAAGEDLAAMLSLVDPGDEDADNWNYAINNLTAEVETYRESRAVRGTYEVDSMVKRTIGDIVKIVDSDTAVDSYALSANAPGRGYISVIVGNGRAFTPIDEPVTVHIIRVDGPLHRGEVKPIAAANPLAEKLTMMHTPDLAAATDQFEYDWRIAAPVDGMPPPVYQKERFSIATANWKELPNVRPGEGRSTLPPLSNDRWYGTTLGSLFRTIDRYTANNSTYSAAQKTLQLATTANHRFMVGDRLRLEEFVPEAYNGVYTVVGRTANTVTVGFEGGGVPAVQTFGFVTEAPPSVGAQSFLVGTFNLDPNADWDDLHISLDVGPWLGVRVWLNGALVILKNWTGSEDTLSPPPPYGFTPLTHIYRMDSALVRGGPHVLVVELQSNAEPGSTQIFDLKVEANQWVDHPNIAGSQWLPRKDIQTDLRRVILGESADVQALADNYVIVRYRAADSTHSTWEDVDGENEGWSKWTDPALAEGWIKRALAGINPFNQRVTDLFSNQADTSASILTQAGARWEGDVALSLENINDFGLIEIYETVLNRGRMLSIDAGINYGPANDALLLAAGYINDLYMMVGNEAWADAANPTIGIGTSDGTYGSIATAMFAFKGQVPTLIEEELALLRGRDDFMQPGTRTRPVYNRMFWNYTRGIDSGEVIYALNYNIQEDNDQGVDGVINADDARKMFPQGHGDAYGHYLMALKGYYHLLMSPSFTWVPRTEAVNILGKPVQVDYSDERKFASAAAAVARSGKQVVDLTWRKDYLPRTSPDESPDWAEMLAPTRGNSATGVTRYWGVDHWASRVAQGALIHWVVGNAMLPEVDPDPTHEGIQKIDRTTVPELRELPVVMESLQVSVDNAEGGLNPLGLPEDTIPMDIDPRVTMVDYFPDGYSHFEQVYARALVALQNAAASFDDAKDVTQLMRSEQDSLAGFQSEVASQELSYKHALIEIYGTPYPDDMGPGRTYDSDYTGPDLFHYMYVDTVRHDLQEATHGAINSSLEQRIDIQQYPSTWYADGKTDFDWVDRGLYPSGTVDDRTGPNETDSDGNPIAPQYISYTLDSHGFFRKPRAWTGRRGSPGEIQKAISDIILAHNEAFEALKQHDATKYELDRMIDVFENKVSAHETVKDFKTAILVAKEVLRWTKFAANTTIDSIELAKELSTEGQQAAKDAVPTVTIAGMAVGGDFLSVARATITLGQAATKGAMDVVKLVAKATFEAFENAVETSNAVVEHEGIGPTEWKQELREAVFGLDMKLGDVQMSLFNIYGKLQNLSAAYENYRSVVAKGDRIQEEREVFRQRTAAIIQGYRTRDAGFRIFRNEKLERYKTLQDTASKYAYLAAKAYDYETGLLNTAEGKRFLNRIVSARALGVITDGVPQFAGSATGDPGLSSVLAEMKADFEVLRGRLGINNPTLQATTASLRMENFRILPNEEGDTAWNDVLQGGRVPDIFADPDIRRYCLGLNLYDGAPVPGIVLDFATLIEPGMNLFGQKLAAGDHAFDATSFATKILSVGVALEGYIGMDPSDVTGNLVGTGGGQSPSGSLTQFLNPQALAANPYVYLIPVGVDTMRSPPLGDMNIIRSWQVQDVAIPLPFNIGASGFSNKPLWTSAQSLTEPIFAIRKHAAFRPLSDAANFPTSYAGPLEYETNNRLVGRSVWNSRWKLVIPGDRLLNDPNEGLNRFIQTINDIKIHFRTYSYAGN